MKIHHLKCWPIYYQAVIDGRKNFEIRINDRDFDFGDQIILEEWSPVDRDYTGRTSDPFEISFMIDLKQYADVKGWGWRIARWLMPHLVILSLKKSNEIELN